VCCALGSLFCWSQLNQWSEADRIDRQALGQPLFDYPLPSTTEVKDRNVIKSDHGVWCIITVEQTMLTSLTPEDIEAYYLNASVYFPRVGYSVGISPDFRDARHAPDGRLEFILHAGYEFETKSGEFCSLG
jgi:hypothetical protein